MNKALLITIIVALGIAIYSLGYEKATTSVQYITNCQTINQSGTYLLANDLLSSTTCFSIGTDDVILNGNGHIIIGSKKANQSGIEIVGHSRVQIENITLKEYGAAISFIDASQSKVVNSALSSNLYALSAINSSELEIGNNVFNGNFFGIYFVNVSKSNVDKNYISESGNRAMGVVSSESNTFSRNFLERNLIPFDAIMSRNNKYESNTFFKNINSLFTVSRNASIISQNEAVNFSVSLPYSPSDSCENCAYAVELFPNESSFKYSLQGNDIHISFTPKSIGMYSLFMYVTDKNNNTDLRKIMYLVGPTHQETVQYYLRGVDPTHGQSISWGNYNADSGSLLTKAPYTDEQRSCSDWIQFSPDELPPYLFGTVSKINFSVNYIQNVSNASIGVERFATYDRTTDKEISLDATSLKKTKEVSFDVNWPINYYWQWYWLTLKVSTQGGWPSVYIDQSRPSKASITYNYSFTPAILSLDSKTANLLSATMNGDEALLETEGNNIMKIKIGMPNPALHYKVFFREIDCNISNDCIAVQKSDGEIDLTLNLKGKDKVRIIPAK